ncbi:putative bifunctional diguanylate cyclase/phosphodiesterase [Lysobacter sp. A3-1-A15]
MTPVLKSVPPYLLQPAEATASERFTRALVALTRAVWHPDCTFETAIDSICQTAAEALQIERVSVWKYEAAECRLGCLSAYDAQTGQFASPESLETLSLEGDDYIAALEDVRTFESAEMEAASDLASSHLALRDYLQRHRIHAVLDAPAFVGGDLQGVICHESILRVRQWSREETTFAASMGDYVAMAFEIARRRRAEAEVEHLRLHDAATGLPNRHYMTELIRQRLLGNTLRKGEVLAVVHVQVDPTGGEAWMAGAPTADEILVRIAGLLRSFTGDGIELARIDSNGFSFLVTTRPEKSTVVGLAESILAALQSLDWNNLAVDPGATIGIALADQKGSHDAAGLLQQGRETAARVCTSERFGYAIYDSRHHASLVEGMHIERALRDGFAKGEFELHYQPEYDTMAGQWVAAEALLRWRVGDRLVVAGEFMGVLEPSRLMLAVGSWVLRQACLDAAGWPLDGEGRAFMVRVNVSARQFDEPGLTDDVQEALLASGLEPARLCLELTETTLMRDIERAMDILTELHDMGVQVAIDDFGTGYASLVYLKRFPIDVLKIDGSFVQGLPDNTADLAIIQAVVSLAAAFRIGVIAEGVELGMQQQALMGIGVHRMQGWLYGKAVNNDEICRMLGSPAPVRAGPTDVGVAA